MRHKLLEALKTIEQMCDGGNPSHKGIWLVAFEAIRDNENIVVTDNFSIKKNVEDFINLTASKLGYTMEDLRVHNREREVLLSRQMVMYLTKKRFRYTASYQLIGDMLNRDHATVMHAVRVVENYLEHGDVFITELHDKCIEIIESA